MRVREYGEADRAALIEQFQALNGYEDLIAGDRRTDRQGAIDSLDEALRRVRDSGGSALVAEQEGQLAGLLFVVVEDDAVFVREELRQHAHVAEFFVREAQRGRGVGKALLGAAERFTASRGLARLSVSVLSGNSDALAAYVRLGFKAYSVDLTKAVQGS
jgi:GNAT superfamily N-acetyltransferase